MKVLVSDTSALVDLERGSLLDATFRLRRAGLPDRPDLDFPRRRLAMFVHGCFRHRRGADPELPKSGHRRDGQPVPAGDEGIEPDMVYISG